MPKQRKEVRFVVKYFFDNGIRDSYTICAQTGLKKRYVNKILKKLRETGSVEDAPRPGRPRKVTLHLRRQLAQIKRKNPKKSARFYAGELSTKNEAAISERSVERALHAMDYHWRLPGRKKLTLSQKAARLAFAHAHLEDDFSETWSFDEAYFNLNRHSNRCWVSASTEESLQEPKRTNAQEKISIGICFAISHGRKSALCFLPKNWNAESLIEEFKKTLLPSIGWRRFSSPLHRFMMDNDGRHQTLAWRAFCEQNRLNVISPWPANSPDFNWIENLFAWLKRYVESAAPTNESTLREAIIEAFNNIPTEHINNLCHSMKDRLSQAIARNGSRTSY
jgi:transposase